MRDAEIARKKTLSSEFSDKMLMILCLPLTGMLDPSGSAMKPFSHDRTSLKAALSACEEQLRNSCVGRPLKFVQ